MTLTLITCSRDWKDEAAIVAALVHADIVIVGDCPTGADAMARAFCAVHDVPVHVHEADWKRYGNSAGPRRNHLMVEQAIEFRDAGHLVEAHAFIRPSSRGTWDCVRRLEAAGFSVTLHHQKRRNSAGLKVTVHR